VRSLSAKVCAKAGPCALPELDDSGNCEGEGKPLTAVLMIYVYQILVYTSSLSLTGTWCNGSSNHVLHVVLKCVVRSCTLNDCSLNCGLRLE